jgi:hypothetical protein
VVQLRELETGAHTVIARECQATNDARYSILLSIFPAITQTQLSPYPPKTTFIHTLVPGAWALKGRARQTPYSGSVATNTPVD